MNENTTFEPIIREKRNWRFVKISALIVSVGVGVVFSYLLVERFFPGLLVSSPVEELDGKEFGYQEPVAEAVASELNTAYKTIVEAEMAKPFQFGIVPEAHNRIVIPPPSLDFESDLADYQDRRAALSAIDRDMAVNDRVANLTFDNGQTLPDVIDVHPHRQQLYQMQDEIMYVAHLANERYLHPVFSARGSGVDAVTQVLRDPFNPDLMLTYPNGRVVNIFSVATLMAKLDPVNAELYQAAAMAMAERGIAYGEYSYSDMAVAKALVDEYFRLVEFERESGLELTW